MNILFVNPPRFNEIVADNPTFIDEERGYNPPLGLLYIASYLEKNTSHDIKVLDAQVEELNYDDDFKNRIKELAPDIVSITIMTFTLIDVIKTIKLIKEAEKELGKKIIITLGGPHATIFPKETARLPYVDYVITGEGEIPFLKLIKSLEGKEKLENIKGLVYKKDGELINNGQQDFISDLDSLPPPARHLTPIKKYNSILGGSHVVTTMFTSRGCPFKCAFCDRPHMGHRFRARSAKSVVNEMAECKKMGIDEILIYDDTFTVQKQRVLDICEEILKRNLKIIWDVRSRVDTVDEEMLARMSQAGCKRIHFGVEAGSEKILKNLKKGITIDQAKQAFALAKKYKIETLAYFMIGSPEEKKEDIEKSISLSKELKADFVHATILTPYPGTELYSLALAKGIIKTDYWLDFAQNPEKNITTQYWEENFTKEELFKFLENFYKSFYGRPSYIAKSLLRVKSISDLKKKARAGLKVLGIKK
ncbi:radical SAM protein [Candidatus Falkowbacteria bacterium]|nr:radical SAM protein [Candidatus Falkowbacteria bacterium]